MEGTTFKGMAQWQFQWLPAGIFWKFPAGDPWAHGMTASLELTQSSNTQTSLQAHLANTA
jgi:hypothetical protein